MDGPMVESDWEKKRKAENKAMLARLKKLPKNNEVVKLAVKRKTVDVSGQDVWKQFEIVEDLVSAARKSVTDGESFQDTIMDLAEALKGLVDKGSSSSENDSDE